VSDNALWVQAQKDYETSLRAAVKSWDNLGVQPPDAETLQSAAATILIHYNKLAGQDRLHVKVPSAAATDGGKSTGSVGGIPSSRAGHAPECPSCGGPMRVNDQKRGEKSPDFICVQANGACGKTNAKGKWYATGKWADKPNPRGAKGNATPVAAGGYDEPPPGIAPEDDDLPF